MCGKWRSRFCWLFRCDECNDCECECHDVSVTKEQLEAMGQDLRDRGVLQEHETPFGTIRYLKHDLLDDQGNPTWGILKET